MVVLRIILVCLLMAFVIAIPIVGIAALAYLIIPSIVTLWVMGVLTGLCMVIAIGFCGWLAIYSILSMNVRGKILNAKPDQLQQDARDLITFLKEKKFKYAGLVEEKLPFEKPYHCLYFLHQSRRIIAEIAHFDDEKSTRLSFNTFWGDNRFVVTNQQTVDGAKPDVVRKSGAIYAEVVGTAPVIYSNHLGNVKELQAKEGAPIQIKSLDEVLTRGADEFNIIMPDVLFQATKTFLPAAIGAAIPILAFGSMIPQIGLFLGMLPESGEIDTQRSTIMFWVMTALVFFISSRLLKPGGAGKKPENKSVDDEIDDLLADIN